MGDHAKQDLRIRTKQFAGSIISLYCKLPIIKQEVLVVGKQMLRSGTSVAANYREASRARSKAEFVSKVETCSQEADETQMWLELLRDNCKIQQPLIGTLWKESDELISIFVTMAKKAKNKP